MSRRGLKSAPRLGFVPRGAALLCSDLFRDTAKMVCHTGGQCARGRRSLRVHLLMSSLM